MKGKKQKQQKKFFQYFMPLGIALLVLVVLSVGGKLLKRAYYFKPYESTNNERVYGDQRIFDEADMLTDSEEELIREKIAEVEYDTGLDLVIVTKNESLKPYGDWYAEEYGIYVPPEKYVMVYADEFWETNKFGYDCAQVLDGKTETGDGIILVDNIYREEETGRIYTWMGTTGKGEELFSSRMIDTSLDVFYDYVDTDYCLACIKYLDSIESQAAPLNINGAGFATVVVLIVMLIYFLVNVKSRAAKVTTRADSYVVGKRPNFPVMSNVFRNKVVTKRYNPPQSSSGGSSGGGGHHISGGGGSHGGGGHSR